MMLRDVLSHEKLSVERVWMPKGENLSFEPFHNELWIVKKGEIILFHGKEKKEFIYLGQVFFLPRGNICKIVSEQKTKCMKFSIPDCLALCERFFFPGITKEKQTVNSSFNSLEMTPLLWEYARHMDILFNECMPDKSLLRIKTLELFHMLNHSYSKKELAGLFFPILKKEDAFARFVEDNYARLRTVTSLAKEAHMSLKSFENRFNLVFGTSPGRWIIRKKIQSVYEEITLTDLPLTDVADKCGFATLSHMTDFCKKHIGKTPSQIRKGRTL